MVKLLLSSPLMVEDVAWKFVKAASLNSGSSWFVRVSPASCGLKMREEGSLRLVQ
ncbi:hypothetical protein DEO72_LG9g1243 [Vigna unguiculata]|uniref:Uncharacterized protein n=1 Tax=Vigna unguiculata TaxID=3917 RepID=A0A4D6MZY2_VIGUN|nr:hypothetical protein DEO72_LG9g1243 [Vigna unguiculata]